MYENGYIPPIVTVDNVIFQMQNNALKVLLIQRRADPFAGVLALPGGYCAAGETAKDAARRVLAAKTGLQVDRLAFLEQLSAFDMVTRDPRGPAVSIAYMGLGEALQLEESDSMQNPSFFPVDELPDLAFDHEKIIMLARERLKAEIATTNIAVSLLPEQFTLTQLQQVYEAVFGHTIDKRNFRKKIIALNLLDETDEMSKTGAHRPAKQYRFKQQKPQTSPSYLF